MSWMQDQVDEKGFLGGCGFIIFVFGIIAVVFVAVFVIGYVFWKEILMWILAIAGVVGITAAVVFLKDWDASVKTKIIIISGAVLLIVAIVLVCMGVSSCSENNKFDNYEQAYIEKCQQHGVTVTDVTFEENTSPNPDGGEYFWGYTATLHCEGGVEVTEKLKDSIYWIGTVHQKPYYEDYLIVSVIIKSDSGTYKLK